MLPMEKIYLLIHNKIMLGPYTLPGLKEKKLKPADLVWYEGLADWTPAGDIAELELIISETFPVKQKKQFSLRGFLKNLFSRAK